MSGATAMQVAVAEAHIGVAGLQSASSRQSTQAPCKLLALLSSQCLLSGAQTVLSPLAT